MSEPVDLEAIIKLIFWIDNHIDCVEIDKKYYDIIKQRSGGLGSVSELMNYTKDICKELRAARARIKELEGEMSELIRALPNESGNM